MPEGEREHRSRRDETPEERAARKAKEKEREERHRAERAKETPEERAERKKREAERDERRRKEETPEERAERKKREAERAERGGRREETEEERQKRKEKEREERKRREERGDRKETEEERAERKRREREREKERERRHGDDDRRDGERRKETEEERAERKRREREREKRHEERGGDDRRKETEEERRIRKEKERHARENETEEERAKRKQREKEEYRKRKEREEREGRKEGGESKDDERRSRHKETEEERAARKEKERAERKAEEKRRAEKEKAKAKKKEEEEEDEYGDDFDAYDDDFDEFEDEGESDADDENTASPRASELKKAMDRDKQEMQKRERAEKEKDRKKHSRRDSTSHSKSDGPKRMDPKKSKHLRKLKEAYIKRYERAQQLSRLVDLEAMTFELADIGPQTEYDLYITNFGSSNATQAATQIPDRDEIEDAPVQTEKIHFKNKEIQVPEDFGLFPRPTGLIKQDQPKKHHIDQIKIDTMGLSTYLHKTYPVFRVLLDESEIASTVGATPSKTDFSTSFIFMTCLPLLTGRRMEAMAFSAVTPQYLMCIMDKTKVKNPIGINPDDDVSHLDGVITVWNVNNPNAPDKLLVTNAALSCGCFSPTKGFIVYAGGKDGGVYLWDLREPDYTHNNSLHHTPSYSYRKKKRKGGELNLTPRFPSYSTDWMATDNHSAPISRIVPMGYNAKTPPPTDTEVTEQIATLDVEGNVMFWVVVELQQKDTEIAETDLGLNIFSKVKLVKSAAMRMNNPQKYMLPHLLTHEKGDDDFKTESPSKSRGATTKKNDRGLLLSNITTCFFECVPDDPTQFLVGTDTGYIIHSSRFGQAASPALYHSVAPNHFLEPRERAKQLAISRDIKYGTAVLSMHYSPTDPDYFLAAFEDGTVSLYKTEDNTPAFTFSTFTQHACICVRWSYHHKGLFFVLDSSGEIFGFDLMRERPDQRLVPICRGNAIVVIKTDDGKEKKTMPTSIELSQDTKGPAKMSIAYDDGHLDLHTLKPDLVQHERSYAFFSQLT